MKPIVLLCSFLITTSFFAQSPDTFINEADAFFKEYVSNGRVNYKAIQSNPDKLNTLVALGKDVRVTSADAKNYQAFWINAYNVHVIDGIIANYPTKSPLNIKGFFDKTTRDVGGKNITLNDIENKLLRAKFPQEARFHFALVCAGLGCPPIISEAYTPNSLEKQLQRQTVKALNDANFVRVKGSKVQLSQIFEWYKGDFTQGGNEVDYINKYRKEALPEKSRVSYYSYDWTLNDLN